ncbi:hypothetical protein ECBP5_0011 [Escherichia phage ECBP5]|uniref:Uncharacterized protein n=1 Tax=Escherichia phage ECBP5 TaxID=1498172 RepID=A0A0F6PKI9_9CAUD|nr:hypothetical protein ECBP5_0011 [Escherichia phage ECBP5]AJR30354.1 hypothetical protein ECBP5_0011 [Escherichia phage ECBP5]
MRGTGNVYPGHLRPDTYERFTVEAMFHQFMQESIGDKVEVVAVVEYRDGTVETVPLSAISFG